MITPAELYRRLNLDGLEREVTSWSRDLSLGEAIAR